MGSELFDQPARWRAEVIADVIPPPLQAVAASAAPAFPQLMPILQRAASHAPPGVCLDVGAGLGGISVLWSQASRRHVIAVEPGAGSSAGAGQLFADLTVVRASGVALPVRSGSVAAIAMVGVTSLVGDLRTLARECRRVLLDHGCICVIDLVVDGSEPLVVGRNWFRPLERVEGAFGPDVEVVERAVADVSVGSWMRLGERVADVVECRHAGEEALDVWKADQRHLDALMDSDRLLIGATTLRFGGGASAAYSRLIRRRSTAASSTVAISDVRHAPTTNGAAAISAATAT
jgi:SAM-dependent methyltransferase